MRECSRSDAGKGPSPEGLPLGNAIRLGQCEQAHTQRSGARHATCPLSRLLQAILGQFHVSRLAQGVDESAYDFAAVALRQLVARGLARLRVELGWIGVLHRSERNERIAVVG